MRMSRLRHWAVHNQTEMVNTGVFALRYGLNLMEEKAKFQLAYEVCASGKESLVPLIPHANRTAKPRC
jgi:hypothetical protein